MSDPLVVLLTGPRGVGKTTLCLRLSTLLRDHGLVVDGVLTEGGVQDGTPFQVVVDLHDGTRRALATADGAAGDERGTVLDPEAVGVPAPTLTWRFDEAGLELGRLALRRCRSKPPDVLVVDQVGPLELLTGRGWLEAMDAPRFCEGTTVLVVNEAVVDTVGERLSDLAPLVVRVNVRDRDVLPRLLANLALGARVEQGSAGFSLLSADLDGTLLEETPTGQRPVTGAVSALAGLLAEGVEVVLCTGRPVARARAAAAELGLDAGLAVCFHGAVIADLADGHLMHSLTIPRRSAAAAVRLVHGRATAYVGEEVWEPAGLDCPGRRGGQESGVRIRVVEDLGAKLRNADAVRLILHPETEADTARIAESIRSRYPDVLVGAAPGGRLAIHRAGVDKLAALRRVCASRGVPADEVVAAGDDLDDAGVLDWAGLGVAVRGASAAVEASADVLVPRSRLAQVLAAVPVHVGPGGSRARRVSLDANGT